MPDQDILLSPARLFYAPKGEELPDPNDVGYGDEWDGNWVYAGQTLAALTMSANVSLKKVKTQQSGGVAVKQAYTAKELTLKTTLAEFTALNLRLVMGGEIETTAAAIGQVGMEELSVGLQTAPDEYAVAFEGLFKDDSNNEHPVRFLFHRGSFTLGGDVNFDYENETGIPLSVEVLADSSQPKGKELFHFQKVTAPALPSEGGGGGGGGD